MLIFFCLLVLCSSWSKPFLPCLLPEFQVTTFTLKYFIYLEVILAYSMRRRPTLNVFACLHTIYWIIHHFPTNSSHTDRNTDSRLGLCSDYSLGASPISCLLWGSQVLSLFPVLVFTSQSVIFGGDCIMGYFETVLSFLSSAIMQCFMVINIWNREWGVTGEPETEQ